MHRKMLKKTVLPQKIVFLHLFFTPEHLEGHGSQVVNGTQRVNSILLTKITAMKNDVTIKHMSYNCWQLFLWQIYKPSHTYICLYYHNH